MPPVSAERSSPDLPLQSGSSPGTSPGRALGRRARAGHVDAARHSPMACSGRRSARVPRLSRRRPQASAPCRPASATCRRVARRLIHLRLRPVQRLAVVRREQHEAHHLARDAPVEQVAHGEEVAQATWTSSRSRCSACRCASRRWRSRPPGGRTSTGRARSRGAGRRGRCRRRGCRRTAPSSSSAIAEHSMCQPGRPRPQGLSQPGRSGVRRLPQHEVHRVALVGRDLHPGAGAHVLERAARELAVVRDSSAPRRARGPRRRRRGPSRSASRSSPPSPRSTRSPAARRVGGSAPSAAMSSWYQRVVSSVIAPIGRPVSPRPRVDLVVDVGDVAHVGDVLLAVDVAEQPEERVEHHHRPGVADVRAVVDRRPADVHPHVRGIERRRAAPSARVRVL